MKRKRVSVERNVAVLKQAELGMPVAELILEVGISEQTEAAPAGSCIARVSLWQAAYVRRNRPPDLSVDGPANHRVRCRTLSLMRQGLYYPSPLTERVSALQIKLLRQGVVAASMSKRIDKSWIVHMSIENAEQDRCVDLFSRPDGSHGFEEFRRDPEDLGGWTPVHYFADAAYETAHAALIAALELVPWLQEAIDRNTSARALLLHLSS